ncbi:hypothetical protein SFRURICE_004425 [Spodoptera frugiperda]|nr:hypothetical protein SFRURICE_004425 [Spodoptera frugiperda]
MSPAFFNKRDDTFDVSTQLKIAGWSSEIHTHPLAGISHGVHVWCDLEHLPAPVLGHVLRAVDVQGLVRVHGDQHLADFFESIKAEDWEIFFVEAKLVVVRMCDLLIRSGRGVTPAITLNLTKTAALTTYVNPTLLSNNGRVKFQAHPVELMPDPELRTT